MKKAPRRPEKVFVKLSLYIFLLIGVFAAFATLKSDSFKGSLELFFGLSQGEREKPLSLKQKINWCPAGFEEDFCEVESESFDQEVAGAILFTEVLVKSKKSGESLRLEQGSAAQKDFFRFKGLVFKSPELAEKLSKPKELQ